MIAPEFFYLFSQDSDADDVVDAFRNQNDVQWDYEFVNYGRQLNAGDWIFLVHKNFKNSNGGAIFALAEVVDPNPTTRDDQNRQQYSPKIVPHILRIMTIDELRKHTALEACGTLTEYRQGTLQPLDGLGSEILKVYLA